MLVFLGESHFGKKHLFSLFCSKNRTFPLKPVFVFFTKNEEKVHFSDKKRVFDGNKSCK